MAISPSGSSSSASAGKFEHLLGAGRLNAEQQSGLAPLRCFGQYFHATHALFLVDTAGVTAGMLRPRHAVGSAFFEKLDLMGQVLEIHAARRGVRGCQDREDAAERLGRRGFERRPERNRRSRRHAKSSK